MKNSSDAIVDELNMISANVREKFGSLSAEQINWKPAADSWSVGQCLEHLIKSNELYFGEFEKLAAGTRKNSFVEIWSPAKFFAGKLLISSLKKDGQKVKTIPSMVPPSEIDGRIVETFAEHNADVAAKIKAAENADWRTTVITSPFMKAITYRLGDALEIMIEHEKRHIRQASRVAQAEEFPAS